METSQSDNANAGPDTGAGRESNLLASVMQSFAEADAAMQQMEFEFDSAAASQIETLKQGSSVDYEG